MGLLNTPICSYPEALLYHLMQMNLCGRHVSAHTAELRKQLDEKPSAGSTSACEQTLFCELDQFKDIHVILLTQFYSLNTARLEAVSLRKTKVATD